MSLSRRTLLLVVATLAGALVAAPRGLPSALAQERGDRSRDDKKKERTPEEKELIAIGKEFKAGDVDALIARVPEHDAKGREGKLRLRLGKNDGTFKRTQAKNMIDEWLESRTITHVKLKSTKDLVGTFVLKYRRRGKDVEVERTLVVRIAKADEGDAFVLKEIEVQAQ